MTERERLIELLYAWGNKENDGVRAEVIADYLLANGVIVLPDIPFGTELYQIYDSKIYKLKLSSYMVREINGKTMLQWHLNSSHGFNGGGNVDEFGKTVFLTKEEAEKTLEGKENGSYQS